MPKGLKKYFLEFLMIFLAVALGFLAENFRESIGERNKEKEYIRWFIKDVQTDTVILHRSIKKCQLVISTLDSMILMMKDNKISGEKIISLYAQIAKSTFSSDFHKSTMMQLKNSEHAGLIQSMRVHDLIARFEYGDLRKTAKERFVDSQKEKVDDLAVQLFDNTKWDVFSKTTQTNDLLIISNENLWNQFVGRLKFYKYLLDDLLKEYGTTLTRFERTIEAIANDYRITKEDMDQIWNLAIENALGK